jgi:predicted RNA-binding Zn ribbon-like protein
VAEDLPILGEPFAVELANSLYASHHEVTDFLTDDVITAWFAHAPDAAGLSVPEPPDPASGTELRNVRDAVRTLLTDRVEGRVGTASARAAQVLHQATQRASLHLALDLDSAPPRWTLRFDGKGVDVWIAEVAARCILFVGGDDVARVRRCERRGCPMLFVQRHRSRRFCNQLCSHVVRQARYRARVTG